MEEEAQAYVPSSSVTANVAEVNNEATVPPEPSAEPVVSVVGQEQDPGAGCASTASSWLNMGSWLSYAKEQSATVYQSTKTQSAHVWGFVKKDLGEFASTIKADSKAVYEQVRGSGADDEGGATGSGESRSQQRSDATKRLRSGLSSLVSTMANAMYIPPDDSDEQALVVTRDGEVCAHDWEKGRIDALRSDPATFLADPQGQPEAFLAFLSEFDADSERQEISELLMASAELRSLYSQLVPAELPHKHFWARYYFRVRAIRDTARQRQELKRRAAAATAAVSADQQQQQQQSQSSSSQAGRDAKDGKVAPDLDTISWDDDDEEDDNANAHAQDTAAAGASSSDLKLCERGDTIVVRHPASGSSEEGNGAAVGATQQQQQQQSATVELHPAATSSQQQQSTAPSTAAAADWNEDEDIDDVELTEEDLKKARELALGGVKSTGDGVEDEDLGEDDWGKWE